MGVQYICDVCGRAHDATRDTMAGGVPEEWAGISVMAPRFKREYEPAELRRPGFVPVALSPEFWLVCSQACAEEALDRGKEYLRKSFALRE